MQRVFDGPFTGKVTVSEGSGVSSLYCAYSRCTCQLTGAPVKRVVQRSFLFWRQGCSADPLAVTAARDAAKQSKGNDANKRLMIVANCHVKRLITRTYPLATGVTWKK